MRDIVAACFLLATSHTSGKPISETSGNCLGLNGKIDFLISISSAKPARANRRSSKGWPLQDLEYGNGFALIDPHGDLVERVANRIPPHRLLDVIYLDAADPTQPYGYNPLRHVRHDRIALAASGLMEVFAKMWPEAWGVRMEHILRNVLMALLEQPQATMHDILRIVSDKTYRKTVAASAPERDGPHVPAEGIRALHVRLPRGRHRSHTEQGRRLSGRSPAQPHRHAPLSRSCTSGVSWTKARCSW